LNYARLVRGRRVLVVVILVMGLTAIAASLNAPDRRVRPGTAPAPTAPPAGASHTVEQTLDADAEAATVQARVGDLVQLRVIARAPDSVLFAGQTEVVDPDSPARFELYADTPGEYPVRLVDAARLVGTVLVRP
jgi:hypothetical protein